MSSETDVLTITSRWQRISMVRLQSNVIHITTKHPLVYVTTTKSSVVCFKIVEDAPKIQTQANDMNTARLELYFNDDIARPGLTHLAIDVPTVGVATASSIGSSTATQQANAMTGVLLASERDGAILGLEIPKTKAWQSHAPTLFEAQLPQCVVKLSQGDFSTPWAASRAPAKGVLVNDIIGAATDGTLYHFSILNDNARILLKFLEKLAVWYQIEMKIREYNSPDRAVFGDSPVVEQNVVIDPEIRVRPSLGERKRKDAFAVNGDVVGTFVGNAEKLMDMLEYEAFVGQRDTEAEAAEAFDRFSGNGREQRCARFGFLVAEAVGGTVVRGEVVGISTLKEAVERCLDWLEEVLADVL